MGGFERGIKSCFCTNANNARTWSEGIKTGMKNEKGGKCVYNGVYEDHQGDLKHGFA
jgi:hypothetical protein